MTIPIPVGPTSARPTSLAQSELESEVTAALSRATDVDAEKLTVSTDHGVVTLSGDVDGAGDRSAPQAVAHQVAGVTAVRNELAVCMPFPPQPCHPPAVGPPHDA